MDDWWNCLRLFYRCDDTKDIVDSEADKKTGTRTLINTLELKKHHLFLYLFLILPFALVPLFIFYHTLPPYLWPLMLFVIPGFMIFYFMLKHSESKTP